MELNDNLGPLQDNANNAFKNWMNDPKDWSLWRSWNVAATALVSAYKKLMRAKT